MKTLRQLLEAVWEELEKECNFLVSKSGRETLHRVLEKHLTQPVDAAAQRKAEVARIAEALFIAASGADKNRSTGNDTLTDFAFNDAESFVAYKETLK